MQDIRDEVLLDDDPTEGESHPALLPCPFCGDLAGMHCDPRLFHGSPGFRVECEGNCHAMTCWWHTLEEAVTHWNRRSN